MKRLSTLSLGCLSALGYGSSAWAIPATIEPRGEAGGAAAAAEPRGEAGGSAAAAVPYEAENAEAEMANGAAERSDDSADERGAKNAIYIDLLGPGLLYSINYDRMLSEALSARVGLSYLSLGSTEGPVSAEFSYWAVPVTVNYLGIGSASDMLEIGGGPIIMKVAGSGLIEIDDNPQGAKGSTLVFAMTGMLGYRHQPTDGGLVFRLGASPIVAFGVGVLPWGYLSLGAAF